MPLGYCGLSVSSSELDLGGTSAATSLEISLTPWSGSKLWVEITDFGLVNKAGESIDDIEKVVIELVVGVIPSKFDGNVSSR
jgi:hypothetical protein